jgi:hypothetical protein
MRRETGDHALLERVEFVGEGDEVGTVHSCVDQQCPGRADHDDGIALTELALAHQNSIGDFA